jgi:two-component system phosphate regulon response regulator PhoB
VPNGSTTLDRDRRDDGVAKGWDAEMNQRTVLVVEDDQAIREVIVEVLDDAGYTVLEADCGRQALRLASEHTLAVVLVDQKLPDATGLDLIERLRASPASRHIPVMLVSGLAHQLARCDHGADLILSKPFDIAELVERVDALTAVSRHGVA